jgi:8-oxo-dGTP pyrophosphatase MutT (NUDIX family)
MGGGGGSGGGLIEHPFLERLARALGAHDAALADRDPPAREAAVALALVPNGEDAAVLLVRRATHDRDPWSAHVALPGGRAESGDESLLHTAIRETQEETGLDLSDATLLGTLSEIRPRSPRLPAIIVRPYVFVVPGRGTVIPSDEIAEAFWAPLSVLFSKESMLRTEVDARGMQMSVDAIHFEGRIIWGMTERILRSLQDIIRDHD